jgi:hypothetical protein
VRAFLNHEPHQLFCVHVLHAILALIRVTYQFANNRFVNKATCKHGIFLSFLSKAAPKCRCFSLAQCSQWKIRSAGFGNVIGSVFYHSWGHYVTANYTGRARTFKTLGCCHSYFRNVYPRRLKVICHRYNHVISTLTLIGLIMSTPYFQNLS